MSSSTCCSTRDPNTYECHWNRDDGFKSNLTKNGKVPTRRKREFTPDELKDDHYWRRRSRNNEAAKRSRERRRMEERLLEERALQLLQENEKLRAALSALKYHGVDKDTALRYHGVDKDTALRYHGVDKDTALRYHGVDKDTALRYHGVDKDTALRYHGVDKDTALRYHGVDKDTALRYHGVDKDTALRYDVFMDCSPVRELAHDPYLRALVDLPGANCAPLYALSGRCDFIPAHGSLPLQRAHSFPAPFPAVHTHQIDRPLGFSALSNGDTPSSSYNNLPHAVTQSQWGQGQAHSATDIYPNFAPFSLNEMMPGYQCPKGTTLSCTTHARMNETYVEPRASVTEPKETGRVKEVARASASPLLPHKLRYKVRARALLTRGSSSPGIIL